MTALDTLFPSEEQIPPGVRLPAYLEQREYLVGGELRTWAGELNPVLTAPNKCQDRVGEGA